MAVAPARSGSSPCEGEEKEKKNKKERHCWRWRRPVASMFEKIGERIGKWYVSFFFCVPLLCRIFQRGHSLELILLSAPGKERYFFYFQSSMQENES